MDLILSLVTMLSTILGITDKEGLSTIQARLEKLDNSKLELIEKRLSDPNAKYLRINADFSASEEPTGDESKPEETPAISVTIIDKE